MASPLKLDGVSRQSVAPNPKIEFKATSANWEIFDSRAPLVRMLEFSTEAPGSFFTKIAILGYRDGQVLISLEFSPDKREMAEKYFEDHRVHYDFTNLLCRQVVSRNKEETEQFFNLFIQDNCFPAERLELITALVASGNWYDVTPLKEGEYLPQRSLRDDDLIDPYA